MKFHLALRRVVVDLEGDVMRHAFTVGPAAGGDIRFDPKLDDGATAALADLVPQVPAVGAETPSVPDTLHEFFGSFGVTYRHHDAGGTAQSVLRRHLRYEVGKGGSGAIVEFRIEPD